MSEGWKPGLFETLPEQGSAERPMAAPRLRKAERRQVSLRPVSLEDLLPADHRARFVWAFAERLDLSALHGAIKAVEGRPGHPPADPRLLLALWLYATVEGVGSARELDRLCREHTGFEWLCGGVGMNHTTLADFRIAHGAVLECLLVDSVAAMLKCGHASLDRVAQDGMRVRAAAGAASFRRQVSLERCRAEAAAEVARLRAELAADPGGLSRRQAAARQRAAADPERRRQAAARAAGLDHGCRGAGDEDARWRLPPGLQPRLRQRSPERHDRRRHPRQQRLRQGPAAADERAPRRSLWAAAGRAPGRWRLRQARRHRGAGRDGCRGVRAGAEAARCRARPVCAPGE